MPRLNKSKAQPRTLMRVEGDSKEFLASLNGILGVISLAFIERNAYFSPPNNVLATHHSQIT